MNLKEGRFYWVEWTDRKMGYSEITIAEFHDGGWYACGSDVLMGKEDYKPLAPCKPPIRVWWEMRRIRWEEET